MEDSMSEENTQVATEAVSEETTQEASTSSTDVGALVAESKKYRKRSQEAETRLAKLESQLANAEKAKLKEKEDFKTLYEENEAKIESLTNNAGVPEDERESLSKLDFETLEYITNKINNMKPNIPQVVGNSRTVPPQKKLSEMTDSEKRDNWQSIINSHKRK